MRKISSLPEPIPQVLAFCASAESQQVMHERHPETKIAAVCSPHPTTYIETSQHGAALPLGTFPLTHILSNTWLKEKTSLRGRQKTKAGLNKGKTDLQVCQ